MAIIHIIQDTKQTKHGLLFPEDLLINTLILEAFHIVALSEEYGYDKVIPAISFGDKSRFTIQSVEYTNPFDILGKLWDVGVKSAGSIAERLLYFKPEYRRRELENAMTVQEIARAKLENVEKAYEFVKRLRSDGMPAEQATQIMVQLLADQGARIRIEPPKDQTL